MAKYNGWTNYETWVVSLWLDNDQVTQEHWREQAAESLDGESVEDATQILAERLQEEHEDSMPSEGVEGTMWGDLLSGALSDVNWSEIAQAMVDAAIEEGGNDA